MLEARPARPNLRLDAIRRSLRRPVGKGGGECLAEKPLAASFGCNLAGRGSECTRVHKSSGSKRVAGGCPPPRAWASSSVCTPYWRVLELLLCLKKSGIGASLPKQTKTNQTKTKRTSTKTQTETAARQHGSNSGPWWSKPVSQHS